MPSARIAEALMTYGYPAVPANPGPLARTGIVSEQPVYQPGRITEIGPPSFAMPTITGQVMPKPTTAVLPTMTGTARALLVTSNETPVKPLDLVRDLPSIVNTEPVYMAPQPMCSPFTQWVSDNPLLAGALLFGAALLVWRK